MERSVMACHNAKLALSAASVNDLLRRGGAWAGKWFCDCNMSLRPEIQIVSGGVFIPEARI